MVKATPHDPSGPLLRKILKELKEIKEKIIDGIEIVVEPALELAMMTQNNEFKIPRNFIMNIFKICRPKN